MFVEEPKPPVIAADSIEIVMSASEGIVVGDVSSADEHMSVETGIAELTQPQEASQELSAQETQSRLPWKRWGKNKVKRTFSRQDLLKPSLDDVLKSIARDKALEETFQEKPIEPPIDVVPEVAPQEAIARGTLQKDSSADVSVDEFPEYRAMHEVITGLNKQKRAAAEVTSAIDDGKEEVCEAITGEKPISDSESYIFEEGSVVYEGLEGISDPQIVSVSEEERAAMSRDHNSVEVAGFVGVINAQPNPAYKGLPINIAYTLRNVACDDPDDSIVQIIVINPDTGIIHEILETPVKCRKGTFSMGGFVIFTTSYETCVYRLNMQLVSEKAKTSHLLTGISLEVKSIF
jgi:hypothetical protein